MKNDLYFAIAFFAAIVTCVAASAADALDDRTLMQGTWKPSKGELSGKAVSEEALQAITLKIDKGSYIVTFAGESHFDKGTCKIDFNTKPKSMDVKSVAGPNQGKTFPAIYELQGDTLTVCYDLSGAKRPTEFKTAPGTMLYLVTYRRSAPDGAKQ